MISLIIPVYGNSTLLEYCLDAATRQLPEAGEIIVVNDKPRSQIESLVRKFSSIKLICEPATRGITAALNLGARTAQGEILVFMNSDVLLSGAVLEALEETVKEYENEVGAVGSLLLYPQDYTIQHAGVAFDKWVLSHLYSGSPLSKVRLSRIEERQAVTAALLACTKTVYRRVKGFDETFRDGLEDIDFCLKCRESGLRNLIISDPFALHIESATRGPYKNIRRTYNYAVFFSRWNQRFVPDLDGYLARSLSMLCCDFELKDPVTVVNFCTTPNWMDLVQATLKNWSGLLGAIHNMSGFAGEHDAIDLYRKVPLALHRSSSPILFVVDHFLQLSSNQHWFAQRPHVDLIVDRHANSLLGKEFVDFSSWYAGKA